MDNAGAGVNVKSSGGRRALGIEDIREAGAVRQERYSISRAGALTDIKALSWFTRRPEFCRDRGRATIAQTQTHRRG
jgi:hypothetical protein